MADSTSRVPGPEEAPVLQERLRRLSERVTPVDAAAGLRLATLAGVLNPATVDEGAAHQWAFADLHRAVDAGGLAERLAAAETRDDRLSQFEIWRNSLVFAPLVITWLGIFDAARAFAALAQADPAAASRPFLYLWQNRFAGWGWFALDLVAILDVILLATMLGLTVYVLIASRRLAARERDAAAALQQEIDSALADADLELAKRRQPQPFAAIGQLARMADLLHEQIKAEGGRVAKLAAEKEQELSQLVVFTPRLAGGAQTMQAAAERLEQAQAGFARLVSELAAPIAELGNRQAELSAALRESAGRAGALQGQQEKAARQAGEMAGQQAALLTETRNQMTHWAAAITLFTPVASTFSRTAADLAGAQTQLLQHLAAERDAQTRLAQAITQADGGLTGAVARVSSSAGDMTALTAELRKLAQAMPDLARAAEQQARSAGELRAAGQALGAAAARIESAAQGMAQAQARP
jgi:methyl-accepting chemotaxis protein